MGVFPVARSRIQGARKPDHLVCWEPVMKVKTRHRKSHKWRKRTDTSPVAKGRRVKVHGTRNPRKRKHLGGKGL